MTDSVEKTAKAFRAALNALREADLSGFWVYYSETSHDHLVLRTNQYGMDQVGCGKNISNSRRLNAHDEPSYTRCSVCLDMWKRQS